MILFLTTILVLVIVTTVIVSVNQVVEETWRVQSTYDNLKCELEALQQKLELKLSDTDDVDFAAGWNAAMKQVQTWLSRIIR